MGQKHRQLNGAPSVEWKKTLLCWGKMDQSIWWKKALNAAWMSAWRWSYGMDRGWWEWPTGWLRSHQLTGGADESILSAHIMSSWHDVAFHHVITWIMRLNTITTPWIHSVTKPVSLFENHRGAFQLLNTALSPDPTGSLNRDSREI